MVFRCVNFPQLTLQKLKGKSLLKYCVFEIKTILLQRNIFLHLNSKELMRLKNNHLILYTSCTSIKWGYLCIFFPVYLGKRKVFLVCVNCQTVLYYLWYYLLLCIIGRPTVCIICSALNSIAYHGFKMSNTLKRSSITMTLTYYWSDNECTDVD